LTEDAAVDGMVEGGGRGGLRSGARRRRWPAARKAVIVSESLVAGVKVSEVAARHGVNANMLSTWRGEALAGDMTTRSAPKAAPISSACTFAPVKVVAGGPQPDARADIQTTVGAIEIVLGDASIWVAKGVDTATLSRVVAAVRGSQA
jgi:transposase